MNLYEKRIQKLRKEVGPFGGFDSDNFDGTITAEMAAVLIHTSLTCCYCGTTSHHAHNPDLWVFRFTFPETEEDHTPFAYFIVACKACRQPFLCSVRIVSDTSNEPGVVSTFGYYATTSMDYREDFTPPNIPGISETLQTLLSQCYINVESECAVAVMALARSCAELALREKGCVENRLESMIEEAKREKLVSKGSLYHLTCIRDVGNAAVHWAQADNEAARGILRALVAILDDLWGVEGHIAEYHARSVAELSNRRSRLGRLKAQKASTPEDKNE